MENESLINYKVVIENATTTTMVIFSAWVISMRKFLQMKSGDLKPMFARSKCPFTRDSYSHKPNLRIKLKDNTMIYSFCNC